MNTQSGKTLKMILPIRSEVKKVRCHAVKENVPPPFRLLRAWHHPIVATLCSLACALQPTTALAVIQVWEGLGADGNWRTTGNFSPGGVAGTDALQFDGSNYLTTNFNNLGFGIVNSVTFNAGAGAFVFNGNGLGTDTGITNLSSNLQTINLIQLTVFQTQTWDAGAAGLIVNSPVLLGLFGGSVTLIVAGAGDTTINGSISQLGSPGGTSGLAKTGAGTLTLTAANTYTDGTTVTDGLINFNALANFGTGNITLDGGGLQWASGNTADISGKLNPLGVNGGVFDTNSNDVTFTSALSGDGAFTKTGAGTLTLSSASSYTSGTTIVGGVLRTENASALGSGPVTLTAGGALQPVGTLTIESLDWNGGTLASFLGSTTSFLEITGDLSLTGIGTFDFAASTGFIASTEYAILAANNLGNFTIADFTGNTLTGVSPIFRLDGDTLFVSFLGATEGLIIQNSGPVFTPLNADFLVTGAGQTGMTTESNIINSLSFVTNGSLQVFNNLAVASGNFTAPTGSATMTGGNVIVPGTFTKLGAGLLNTFSNVFVNGPANVVGGSLLVNGTFTAGGGLTVFQNALLGGSGLINGNLFNNGTVSPGNSPGTLTVNGNFTQSSSGSLQIEVASPTVFDQLVVSGNASLAGTLQVLNYGGNQLAYGRQVPFLRAGSISGEFDQIQMPNPAIFRGRFLVNGGNGTLLVAPTSYTLVAQTTNQQNVAKALDSFIPATSGDRLAVSTALDLQTAEQYPAAFDQIAPTFYESLANTTIEQTNAQNQMLAQRLSAARLGARGFQAIGIEAPLTHDKSGQSVLDAKNGKDILTPSPDNKWGVWAQGNGIFAKVTNVSQVPNYRFESGGFLAGADYQWNEGFVTGVFAGYQGLYSKYNGGGSNTINSALFGGYATYQKGGFYSDAIVSGGYSNYNVRRPITFSTVDRTAVSQPDGGQFNTYLDFGYDWKVGGFTLGPIVSGQYTYAGIAPFTESGADSLNLRVNQQNANSLRTSLGGRIAYTWKVSEKIAIIPEVRMFWQHEFLNNPRNIGAALDGGSGPAFGYETSAPARDSVFAGAGVSAQLGDRWNAYFYYNADFGRQDFVSNMISGGLGWKF